MGHSIPEPFSWDESFCVFYAKLDEEHKQIFQGIFACTKTNNQANLDSLKSVVKNHFVDEEAELAKIVGYDIAGHKAKHDEFLANVTPLKAPLDDTTINYAKNWLVQHIKNTDFTYKGQIA